MKIKNVDFLKIRFTKDNKKVRGDCHFTEKCRGAAHKICNLRYKTPKEI